MKYRTSLIIVSSNRWDPIKSSLLMRTLRMMHNWESKEGVWCMMRRRPQPICKLNSLPTTCSCRSPPSKSNSTGFFSIQCRHYTIQTTFIIYQKIAKCRDINISMTNGVIYLVPKLHTHRRKENMCNWKHLRCVTEKLEGTTVLSDSEVTQKSLWECILLVSLWRVRFSIPSTLPRWEFHRLYLGSFWFEHNFCCCLDWAHCLVSCCLVVYCVILILLLLHLKPDS